MKFRKRRGEDENHSSPCTAGEVGEPCGHVPFPLSVAAPNAGCGRR